MDKAWLTTKLDCDFAELSSRLHQSFREARPDMVGTEHDKPGGFVATRWEAFAMKYQEGDEIWQFHSSSGSWSVLAGRAGYAIVRNGEIVGAFVTIMS